MHVRRHVHVRPLRELPLQLTRFLPALMLACACSDAKPRPAVVEDAGDVSIALLVVMRVRIFPSLAPIT